MVVAVNVKNMFHPGLKPEQPIVHFAKFTRYSAMRVKRLHFIFLILLLPALAWKPHPFFVSVTELKYNAESKTMEISCKMFTNDLEDALKKTSGKKIDILHPKDKKEVEAVLFSYIQKRLQIKVNGKALQYTFIGFEKEEDAIWTYLECKSEKPKTISADDKLLYDYLKSQINIVHVNANGKSQSSKVSNPESVMNFDL